MAEVRASMTLITKWVLGPARRICLVNFRPLSRSRSVRITSRHYVVNVRLHWHQHLCPIFFYDDFTGPGILYLNRLIDKTILKDKTISKGPVYHCPVWPIYTVLFFLNPIIDFYCIEFVRMCSTEVETFI